MEWRAHPSIHGLIVSDDGQVAKILKPQDNGLGYLFIGGKGSPHGKVYVHDLVMTTFVGPRPPKAVINHLDGNPRNNVRPNLEYCSVGQNLTHRYRVLNHPPVGAKLTPNQVREMRSLPKSVTHKQAGEMYGVSWMTALRVRRGKSHKGV